MIDGIDYFPKRDKSKKGIDREWDDLKKIKHSQETRKTKTSKTESKPGGENGDAPK
jgi:hypothetical protein